MIQQIDLLISETLIHFRTPILNNIFVFLSFLGNNGLIWIIIGLYLIYKKHYIVVKYYYISGAITFVLGEIILKNLIARQRPFITYEHIQALVKASAYSMPSSHASSSFAFATILMYFFPKWRYYFLGLAILISLSRVYVGVHYFSDILAGALLGTVVSYIIIRIFKMHN